MTDELRQEEEFKTTQQRMEEENETGEILQAQTPVEELQQEYNDLLASLKETDPEIKVPTVEKKPEAEDKAVPSRRAVIRAKAENAAERDERRKERAEFLSDWGSMQTAMHQGVYNEAVIAGVEELPEYEEKIFLSFFIKDRYRCLIPFSEIFREDMGIDKTTVDPNITKGKDSLVNRQRQMARKFIGVRIPYVITNMELDDPEYPENHLILASRRKALAIIENINYAPRRKADPIIQEGNVEIGTIVNLANNGMLINVGGVDTLMPLHQITHRYVFNLYQEEKYKPGMNIKVQVTSIEKDPTYGYVIKVNAKNIELMDAKKYSYKLPKNKKAEANMIVTNGFMSGLNNVMFNGWLDKYNMPAVAMFVPTSGMDQTINPGKIVRVKIGKQRADGKVECVVTRIEDISVAR